MKIALIGLGAMGRAMAANLVAAGHSVSAWTRSGRVLDGVTRMEVPGDAFKSDVVITMLSDDAAIREVILEADILANGAPGIIHVVMSTISVAFAKELTKIHAAHGISYVSAPVLGRPDVAAQGALNILAAGDPDAIDALGCVFNVLGKQVWRMGAEPSGANAAKIACNMMIAMAIEAMAEAVVLTQHNGVERETFFDLILNTLFGGRSYQVYSKNMTTRAYEPGFRAALGLKDLRLAADAAVDANSNLPMCNAVVTQMESVVNAGLGDKDWSIIAAHMLGELAE